MEFMSRGVRQDNNGQETAHTGASRSAKRLSGSKGARLLTFVLLIGVALVILATCLSLVFGGVKSENSFVKKDKFQAVFLNGGQVYFGKVRSLNNKYLTMDNIYYLRVNQQVQPNQTQNSQQDISLAKLGCELHGPEDSMVVNREQVTFWENLKDDGQVVKAINEFVKANPQGQKCTSGTDTSTTPTPAPTPTPTPPAAKKP